jgi:hypothetical protein
LRGFTATDFLEVDTTAITAPQRKKEERRWKMEDERWKIEDERWKMEKIQ